MANYKHLNVLSQGVNEWNKWRKGNPKIEPDLSKAKLSKANLSGADLSWANLSWARLLGANLVEANLTGANLLEANLTDADLSLASLGGANLRLADLRGANLSEANLTNAILNGADLRNAYCGAARLINTNLNAAKLTGACLWETQRAGWSIKGLICESIYWDSERKEKTLYKPGDFERLFAESTRIKLFYKGGITPLEIATLPALIQHLETSYADCTLRFHSIEDSSGGAIVTIVAEPRDEQTPEQLELLRRAIQAEAEQKAEYLREALREENLLLKGQVQALDRVVSTFLTRPTYQLEKGDIYMRDLYNISGQAGAVGPDAQAQDMTFNQIGSQIENSMALTDLAKELETLRQALKEEATTEEHDGVIAEIGKAKQAAEANDSSKVAKYLKASGKWAFDVATKIGVSLATEAIKQSAGMK